MENTEAVKFLEGFRDLNSHLTGTFNGKNVYRRLEYVPEWSMELFLDDDRFVSFGAHFVNFGSTYAFILNSLDTSEYSGLCGIQLFYFNDHWVEISEHKLMFSVLNFSQVNIAIFAVG